MRTREQHSQSRNIFSYSTLADFLTSFKLKHKDTHQNKAAFQLKHIKTNANRNQNVLHLHSHIIYVGIIMHNVDSEGKINQR